MLHFGWERIQIRNVTRQGHFSYPGENKDHKYIHKLLLTLQVLTYITYISLNIIKITGMSGKTSEEVHPCIRTSSTYCIGLGGHKSGWWKFQINKKIFLMDKKSIYFEIKNYTLIESPDLSSDSYPNFFIHK